MKKYNKIIFAAMLLGGVMTSCHDLDIPPKNILTSNDIYTEAGITADMAALYGRLPMEDFNTSDQGSHNGLFFWNCITWDMLCTGETVNHNNTGFPFGNMQKEYWSDGYQLIRQANILIKDLPNYVGKLDKAEEWIAEAKFVRAYTYFYLVKRYGGVPLLQEPQDMTGNNEDLYVARSSHKACIDFILEDLDYAIEHMTATKTVGRANKYVAAALKSRVALYAGSVARYGGKFDHTVEGVQVCGIPSADANSYFKQAYDAATVVEQGGYELYEKDADKAKNFQKVFLDAENSDESIFIRQYNLNNSVHSFDAVYCPHRMTTTYGDRYCVTLDFVELFDGLPLDPKTGHLKTTDDEGNYLVYNNEKELFQNAEPRLRGSVMLPGETYKGVTLDMRAGVIKEDIDPSTKIQKFVADDGQTTINWSKNPWFKEHVVTSTQDTRKGTPMTLSNCETININGQDGPTNGGNSNSLTGFHGLKWINTNLTVGATTLHKSVSPWIDIRYAEVLLNRAEAAVELAQNGVENYADKDMLQDAMTCINKVRQRAGANLLTSTSELSSDPIENERGTGINSFVFAPTKGLQVVRVERYKELAFEHKVYWDLRRWFTFDTQIKDYRRRMLAPFLFAKGAKQNTTTGNPEGKYIYDTRVCERASNNGTFATKYYYDKIPDSQRKINPLLVQNDQY